MVASQRQILFNLNNSFKLKEILISGGRGNCVARLLEKIWEEVTVITCQVQLASQADC